jgi:hypothetical protein
MIPSGKGDSMSSENDTASAAKLPILKTIEDGFFALRPVRRAIGLQLLLFLAIEIALGVIAVALSGDAQQFFLEREPSDTKDPAYILTMLVDALIAIVIYINLSIGTTRWILFTEPPTIAGLFRWGRRQWRLLGTLLLLGLAAAVPIAIGAFMAPLLGPLLASPVAVLALRAIYGLCWLWAAGWLLFLPSIIASDGKGSAIDFAWRVSSGHRLRLIGLVLCGLAANLLVSGSGLLAANFLNVDLLPIRIAGHLLTFLAGTIIFVVFAAAAAVAYRRLTGTSASLRAPDPVSA